MAFVSLLKPLTTPFPQTRFSVRCSFERSLLQGCLGLGALKTSELRQGAESPASRSFHVPVMTSILPSGICPHPSGPAKAAGSLTQAQLYSIPQTPRSVPSTLTSGPDAEACSLLSSPLLGLVAENERAWTLRSEQRGLKAWLCAPLWLWDSGKSFMIAAFTHV